MPELHNAIPILRVSDLAASLEHYVKVLGFAVQWQDPGVIGCVSRGRCSLFLTEGDQGNRGSWVWIGVDEVEPLHEEYLRTGATIRHPPTNYPWAFEMQVADPDGNVLRFGAEPKENEPFGDWRDMRGDLWERTGEGGWRRRGA